MRRKTLNEVSHTAPQKTQLKVKLFLENVVIITAMTGRRNSVWKPKNVLIDTEGLFIKESHGICLTVFFYRTGSFGA